MVTPVTTRSEEPEEPEGSPGSTVTWSSPGHPPAAPPTPPPPPSVWPVLSESVQRAVSPSFRLFQKRKLSLCELFASPLPQWEPRRLPRLQPGAPSSTVHTVVVDGGVDGTPPRLPASVGVLLLGLRHGEILEDKKSFIGFFFLCSAALALEKHLQISFPPLGMFF